MNVRNYQRVLDQITQHPETWNQKAWHCDTTHCVAGWAQLLAGHPQNDTTVIRDARIALDLSLYEANYLFSSDRSLEDLVSFRDRYIRDGCTRDWYTRDGHTRDMYDLNGYDRDGLDRANRPREAPAEQKAQS